MRRHLATWTVCFTLVGTVVAGEHAHWGYSGAQGPEHWGTLAPEYAVCSNGKNQPPINLTAMIEADLPEIQISYQPVPLEVVNNGHTIKANYAPGSQITVEGRTFKLLQVHFHTPSENQIEGRSYPMEAHLVHADAAGNLAVLGVMFTEGRANAGVAAIWDHMPAEAGKRDAPAGKTLNVMDLLPAGKDYYRFSGSLTTPPCSEGVLWMVLKEPVGASKEQVEKFHAVMHHDNNRPVQSVNARPILQ